LPSCKKWKKHILFSTNVDSNNFPSEISQSFITTGIS
jgi:hypothetical protein